MTLVRAVRWEADSSASRENERGQAGNSRMDNSFQEFCYKRELRNGAIFRKTCGFKRGF